MGSDSPHADGAPARSPHAEPHIEKEQEEEPSGGFPVKKRTGEEELPRAASVAEPAVADSDDSVAEVLSDGETASDCQHQSAVGFVAEVLTDGETFSQCQYQPTVWQAFCGQFGVGSTLLGNKLISSTVTPCASLQYCLKLCAVWCLHLVLSTRFAAPVPEHVMSVLQSAAAEATT